MSATYTPELGGMFGAVVTLPGGSPWAHASIAAAAIVRADGYRVRGLRKVKRADDGSIVVTLGVRKAGDA